jgi:hypothetical protein
MPNEGGLMNMTLDFAPAKCARGNSRRKLGETIRFSINNQNKANT